MKTTPLSILCFLNLYVPMDITKTNAHHTANKKDSPVHVRYVIHVTLWHCINFILMYPFQSWLMCCKVFTATTT
jgi:hypothetical protein